MQSYALDVRIIRWLVRLQVPFLSKFFILVYARAFQSKWYSYRLSDFRTLMSFMLRRADLRSALKKSALSKKVCAPIDGCVVYAGPISHDLTEPVKGAGFNVAQLVGLTLPELTSGIVVQVCSKSAQHIYAPCDIEVERVFTIDHPVGVAQAFRREYPGLYSGTSRQVIVAKTKQGAQMVMVLIGSRYFGDIMCPVLEGFNEDAPLSFSKGDSIGYFIQGSAVVILGGDQSWSSDLIGQYFSVLTDLGEST